MELELKSKSDRPRAIRNDAAQRLVYYNEQCTNLIDAYMASRSEQETAEIVCKNNLAPAAADFCASVEGANLILAQPENAALTRDDILNGKEFRYGDDYLKIAMRFSYRWEDNDDLAKTADDPSCTVLNNAIIKAKGTLEALVKQRAKRRKRVQEAHPGMEPKALYYTLTHTAYIDPDTKKKVAMHSAKGNYSDLDSDLVSK